MAIPWVPARAGATWLTCLHEHVTVPASGGLPPSSLPVSSLQAPSLTQAPWALDGLLALPVEEKVPAFPNQLGSLGSSLNAHCAF